MSEMDLLQEVEDLVARAIAGGIDQQQALRAGGYTIQQIKAGIVREKHQAKVCWAAFGDGWRTRSVLEGSLRGPKHGN